MNNRGILSNSSGIATIIVLSSIAILTFVMYEFAFESQLSNFRIIGQQHKLKARLNAEAGLNLALAKLKLYRLGYNMIEKNKQLKEMIPLESLQSIVTMPFVYPIPIGKDANLIQKNALKDFEKNNLIEGGISLTIASVSGFLNPNNMRLPPPEKGASESTASSNESDIHTQIEQELITTLEQSIEDKKQNDEVFQTLYGDVEPRILIKELKYYVNARDRFQDAERGEIEGMYYQKGVSPKHAPLTSISELYLLEGWKDDIVDLIKDRLTVHESGIIDLNKLTNAQLKVLFPTITEEQIADFFEYRDGTPANNQSESIDLTPNPFKSTQEFRHLIVEKLAVVDGGVFDKRIEELKKAKLVLGVAGKLFKVNSIGTYHNASYKIIAYIDLPLKPLPKPTPTPPTPEGIPPNPDDVSNPIETPPGPNPEDKKKEPPPQEILEPRIIEIEGN